MRQAQARTRRGFSLIELVIVMLIMGIVAGLAVPKLNLGGYRADAAAIQLRSALQTAQRTALTRQHDVIVSVDTARARVRIILDADNSGTLDAEEVPNASWRSIGASDGSAFTIPPRGVNGSPVTAAVVGTSLKRVNGLPSVIFHRDGSASSDAELYVVNAARGTPQYRAVTLVRSTGRADSYRFAGTATSGKWEVVR